MTIKDLAAITGYSVGTISRVLNNQAHVSEQAREIILKAANDFGFRLNENAKQLKQQQRNAILVMCKGRANELFESLLVIIQSKIAKTNHPLVVDYVDESENAVKRAVQLCEEKKPMGVIFLGGNREEFLEDFHQIRVPCVLVTGQAENLPFENLSSVTTDDTQAAKMAVEHLVSWGHRNIAVVGGDRNNSDITMKRYLGCLEAFERGNIAFEEDRDYASARYTFEDAYRATVDLFQRNPDFTALFAMSDVMATGAIRALKDLGKRVPEDVSVLGIDGLSLGAYTIPRLSTISQNVEALASKSVELLMDQFADGSQAAHCLIPVTLTVRESVKKI